VPERKQAKLRHARHYLSVLNSATLLYLRGGKCIEQALTAFASEWSNISESQRWAESCTKIDAEAARLCSAFPRAGAFLLDLCRPPHERIRWFNAAVNSARALGLRSTESENLVMLGTVYGQIGDRSRAEQCHQDGAAILREMADSAQNLTAAINIATDYLQRGEPHKAIELYDRLLVQAREKGSKREEGSILGNLSYCYDALGDQARAINLQEQSVAISRALGDRRSEGESLGSLGIFYAKLGQNDHALRFLEQCLAIIRAIGDREAESKALSALGNLYLHLGQINRAIDCFRRTSRSVRREEISMEKRTH